MKTPHTLLFKFCAKSNFINKYFNNNGSVQIITSVHRSGSVTYPLRTVNRVFVLFIIIRTEAH